MEYIVNCQGGKAEGVAKYDLQPTLKQEQLRVKLLPIVADT